jgi:hypothetical protein
LIPSYNGLDDGFIIAIGMSIVRGKGFVALNRCKFQSNSMASSEYRRALSNLHRPLRAVACHSMGLYLAG